MYALTAKDVRHLFDLQKRNNVFETILKNVYTKLVMPGDWVIDGGAHTGMHTLPLATLVNESGRVFAFEPIPQIFETLCKSVLSLPQIFTSNCAIAAESGTTEFMWSRLHRAIPESKNDSIVSSRILQ